MNGSSTGRHRCLQELPTAGVAAPGLRRLGAFIGAQGVRALKGVLLWLLLVPATAQSPINLRIVGGLAGVHQYTRHEEPFWTRELPRLSQGRLSAEIVPFDRAGLRGPEMLSLVRQGVVPVGTMLLAVGGHAEQDLAAADLAGLNPDADTLRRRTAAMRPHLQAVLAERYRAELLAVYVYPAQVTWCRQAFGGMADLAGRRVRVSSPTQADLMTALQAQPVSIPFADIVPALRSGRIDCAVTGTMSGYSIGLHEPATHLHVQPLSWGLSVFVAHKPAWEALPEDLRQLLSAGLARLEQSVWEESARETAEGISCSTGRGACSAGPPGRMTAVAASDADRDRVAQAFREQVLPRWLQRCGDTCRQAWRQLDTGAAPVQGR